MARPIRPTLCIAPANFPMSTHEELPHQGRGARGAIGTRNWSLRVTRKRQGKATSLSTGVWNGRNQHQRSRHNSTALETVGSATPNRIEGCLCGKELCFRASPHIMNSFLRVNAYNSK